MMATIHFAQGITTSASAKLEQWEAPTDVFSIRATALFLVVSEVVNLLGIAYHSIGLLSFSIQSTVCLLRLSKAEPMSLQTIFDTHIAPLGYATKSSLAVLWSAFTVSNKVEALRANTANIFGPLSVPAKTPSQWKLAYEACVSHPRPLVGSALLLTAGVAAFWALRSTAFSDRYEAVKESVLELADRSVAFISGEDAPKTDRTVWREARQYCTGVGGTYEGAIGERFTCLLTKDKHAFGQLLPEEWEWSYCYPGTSGKCTLPGFTKWIRHLTSIWSASWHPCAEDEKAFRRYSWHQYPHMKYPEQDTTEFCGSHPLLLTSYNKQFDDQTDKSPSSYHNRTTVQD